MNNKFYEFILPEHIDLRGSLIPIEFNNSLPFTPKRVYFLRSTAKDQIRGAHSHHIEEEIFICANGFCTALIDTDGTGKKEIKLNDANKAIYVGKNTWHEFKNFSDDAILLCLSSVHYMPGEINYELNYEQFKKNIK
jgi:dTDP-4-dehydrorhamnose 3,5-epimerase-like enzyme